MTGWVHAEQEFLGGLAGDLALIEELTKAESFSTDQPLRAVETAFTSS